jgi:hypothetical protein
MVDLDVAPVPERAGQLIEAGPVGLLEVVQRLIAEHHPEPVCISGLVPFQYPNSVLGTALLEQRRQIEPGWASANDEDVERT